ncbi:MAG: hypothetical protein GEU90_06505 [Gemmatimonas sp.]|nr:hypothetical protein [Gemmatimonas sp.]
MRPRQPIRMCVLVALSLPTLGGCRGDVEPAEAGEAARAMEGASAPFDSISPEELYGASPAENVWSPRLELEAAGLPDGWEGIEIAIIADPRLGGWNGNEEVATAAVQMALEANPDLIVLLGDFLVEGTDFGLLQRVFAPIRDRPVYAVLGERDIRSDSIAANIAAALQSVGVRVLRNAAAPLVINGDTAWIAGADPELLNMGAGERAYILATLGVPGRTPLLLMHTPGLARGLPNNRYPIVLVSDTFCGDVPVPGSGSLARLRETTFPDAAVEGVERLFQLEGSTLVVNCGIGYSFVPLRFGAPPEVPIVTLAGLGEPTEAAVDTTTAVPDSLTQSEVQAGDSASSTISPPVEQALPGAP